LPKRYVLLHSPMIAVLVLMAMGRTPGPAAISSYRQDRVDERSPAVLFFDILDLPARIDEPKLRQVKDGYLLNCAAANRSGEELLGLRLILMAVDSDGKLRTRMTWNEKSELAAYSIRSVEFHPLIKDKLQSTDKLFLAVDEVIGRETIWRAVDADKALRAYSRGQYHVMPKIQKVANKVDPRPGLKMLPLEKKQ
jgi:hypothetical protein